MTPFASFTKILNEEIRKHIVGKGNHKPVTWSMLWNSKHEIRGLMYTQCNYSPINIIFCIKY